MIGTNKEQTQPKKEGKKKGWNVWTDSEKQRFITLMPTLEQRYNEYLKYYPNRNYTQIKSFYHNLKKQKQRIQQRLANNSGPILVKRLEDQTDSSGPLQYGKSNSGTGKIITKSESMTNLIDINSIPVPSGIITQLKQKPSYVENEDQGQKTHQITTDRPALLYENLFENYIDYFDNFEIDL